MSEKSRTASAAALRRNLDLRRAQARARAERVRETPAGPPRDLPQGARPAKTSGGTTQGGTTP